MLSSYASLCSIYAAQHGGLPNQENPAFGSDKVKNLIKNEDIPLLRYSVEILDESHKLIRQGRQRACKAHINSIFKNEGLVIEDFGIKYEHFEPYNELVTTFEWDVPYLPEIPKEFFLKFPNLQYFSLESGSLLKNSVCPLGASNLPDLETVKLQNVNIPMLPKDILQIPEMKTMNLINLPLKSIDVNLPQSSKLKKLVLQNLPLTSIPKQLCSLTELEELYIDYVPIVTLPNEMAMLTKLKILSLKGIKRF